MSVPVSTKSSRKPNLDLEDGIEYPSSDGKPMGETGTHARVALMNIYGVLDRTSCTIPRSRCTPTCLCTMSREIPSATSVPMPSWPWVCRMSPTDGPTRSGRRERRRRGVRSDLEEDSQAGSDEEVRDLPGCPAGSRVLPLRPFRGVSRPIVAGIPSGCRELRADPHDQGRDAERGSRAGAPAGWREPAVLQPRDRQASSLDARAGPGGRSCPARGGSGPARGGSGPPSARREAEQEVQHLQREVEELRRRLPEVEE